MLNYHLPLQKDLEILRREVNLPTGRFEYMLFQQGKHVATRKDDRDHRWAAVFVTRDGKLILESLRSTPTSFESYILEDNFTFIIKIKS